jgi:hypothetical protein
MKGVGDGVGVGDEMRHMNVRYEEGKSMYRAVSSYRVYQLAFPYQLAFLYQFALLYEFDINLHSYSKGVRSRDNT